MQKPNYDYRFEIKPAPTVNPKIDRIRLIATHEMIPLVYLNGRNSYINEHLLKKLKGGDLTSNLTLVVIGAVVYIMCQLVNVDGFSLLGPIGHWNAPNLPLNLNLCHHQLQLLDNCQ